MNSQIFKLDLEKAEEPKFKLLTSVGSSKKQENTRKTSTSALLIMPKPLIMCITTNWKNLKGMGIPDHLTCLLRNLYEDQKQQLEPDMEQHTGSKLGILLPCLFNLHAEYMMRNAGLDEAQAGIKIAERNINNFRYADDTTLMAESEELKSLLMRVKEESEKLA